MKALSRRRFLQASLAGAAALTLPAGAWARTRGANDEIRVGVIGFRARGRTLINSLHDLPGVRVTSLCDVDPAILAREVKRFKDRGETVAGHTDFRRLIADPSLDVIATATPNHWHALITILACQAGKDVYVEKPISHSIHEGRVAAEAARKYRRIVQTGTQGRSSECILEAVEHLHGENPIGRIQLARGFCYRHRQGIGRPDGPLEIPEGLDHDLWLGPAPEEPVRRRRFHYDWHWFWNYGNGDLGNQGPHQMDIARWILGKKEVAPSVFSVGGRVGYDDNAETYSAQYTLLDYQPVPILFEVRNLANPDNMGNFRGMPRTGVSVVIEGEGGYLAIPSNYREAVFYDRRGREMKRFESPRGDHFANFIDAVRSRRARDLNSDALEGHLSAALCHMGNISNRLGAEASLEEIEDRISADNRVAECHERMRAHLEANEVDLEKERLKIGLPLLMDPKTERFTNNREANRMAVGTHRAPYSLPRV